MVRFMRNDGVLYRDADGERSAWEESYDERADACAWYPVDRVPPHSEGCSERRINELTGGHAQDPTKERPTVADECEIQSCAPEGVKVSAHAEAGEVATVDVPADPDEAPAPAKPAKKAKKKAAKKAKKAAE